MNDDPDNTGFLGMLAEHYRESGKNEEAFLIYEKLFKIDSGHGVLQLSFIDFLADLGEYDQVVSNLNILLLNENVTKDEKLQIFSRLLNDKNLFVEEGDQIIVSALIFNALYKDDPAVALFMAEIYEKVGKDNEAVDVLIDYTTSYPNQYYVWDRLLLKLNDTDRTDELYKYSKAAATKFNMAPLPKLLFALAATERDEYETALNELNKVAIIVDNQPDYMMQILSMEADIHYRMEDYNEAFKTYEEALIIVPEDPVILNNYAYFLSEQERDLKKAGKMIKKCLDIESNATYLDTYAWILFKMGKYRNAEKVMNNIFVSSEVIDPDILEHYGYIKSKLKECDEAVTLWQAVLRIDKSRKYLIEEIENCLIK